MGFFDKLLSNKKDVKPGYAEAAMLMLPLVGPFAAAANMDRKRKKALSEQETLYDYVDNDPLSQRVAQRMLMRTGEETIPGIMAHTTLSQEAKTAPRMSNAFDNASKRMMAAGQVEAGGLLGAYGNQAYGAPIKPSEAGVQPRNYRMPDGSIVTLSDPAAQREAEKAGAQEQGTGAPSSFTRIFPGKEMGMTGDAANDLYGQEYADKDKTIPIGLPKKLDNAARVSVSSQTTLDSGLTDSQKGEQILQYNRAVGMADEITRLTRDIRPLLTPQTVSLGGDITDLASKAKSFFSFAASMAGQYGDSGALQQAAQSKGLEQALAGITDMTKRAVYKSLALSLGYTQAKLNNFNEGGGGRSITAADIEDAMVQTGYGVNVDAARVILDRIDEQALRRMDYARASTMDLAADPKRYSNTEGLYNEVRTRIKTRGGDGPSGDDVLTDEEIDALIKGKRKF